ncbi:hypothetical protein GH714_020421 [Hevea brasiliensis]|uniref:Nucleoside phosphorylase domain-containing protein n=1 Tax=Hevea brasiliensis TaxID=3981 RepID=A0A6A6M085_HEVBR|nr:hypothetical protein GH714_020421 [Hevea brasiliensis]
MAVAGPRRMMWAVEMAVVVMIGLLAMASPTMQVSMKNPLREAVQKISEKTTVFAIIVTANSSEKAFNESGIFNPISSTVYKGRIFLLGTIQGSKFVFVNSPSFPTVDSVQVVHGLSISSAKASVNNEAYKNFLYTFKTSVVDTSSVAVALGAHTNELPFILFNGVSNYADGSDVSNNSLANANAVKVLNNFIYLLLIGLPLLLMMIE